MGKNRQFKPKKPERCRDENIRNLFWVPGGLSAISEPEAGGLWMPVRAKNRVFEAI
jgi:hypothetical protein